MKDFKTFAKENKVRIPLIQRDYVQGSDANANKRNKFLDTLLSALKSGETLLLDFIYGSENRGYFEPLDGQQRITTLFLLYYVLKGISAVKPDEKLDKQIQQFTYTTRNSSTAFCQKLFAATNSRQLFVADEEQKHLPSSNITDQPWFCTEWQFDPTIRAMLNMLDAIYTKLQTEEYKNEWNTMSKNLYDNEQSCIGFEYLNIGEYNLDDSLYVKMNARGKQLTDFENWKAEFIKYLEVHWKNKVYRDEPIRSYFEQHIEHEWTDILWSFAVNEAEGEEYPKTDELFMKLYDYLLRMEFFVHHPKIAEREVKVDDFDKYKDQDISLTEDELNFIFDALNFFVDIRQSDFWNELFYVDGEFSGKVRLFDNPGSTDLFSMCVHNDTKKFIVKLQVLLYCVLRYCIKYHISSVNPNLVQYVRVCRNLIDSIFWKDNVSIASNVRLADMAKYDVVITQLIANPDVYKSLSDMEKANATGFGNVMYEKEKATWGIDLRAIEDFAFIRGNLQALNKQQLIDNTAKVYEVLQVFENAQKQEDKSLEHKIIRILISYGFRGIGCGWCKHGKRYFYGTDSKWDSLFFNDDDSFKGALRKYIEEYCNGKDIDKQLQSIQIPYETTDAIAYYMLTYPSWDNHHYNYLSVANDDKNSCDYILLRSYSSNPLLAYHSDLFSTAVCDIIQPSIREPHSIEIVPCQYAKNNSHLLIDKKWTLTCRKEGWHIRSTTNEADLPEDLKTLSLDEKGSYRLLPDAEGKDKVETAVEFIKNHFGV